ncbi:MAG: nucleotidyltransferase family protein [Caldilineaceae bacterium]|nr:nucleotidyltransferase family protein [Caldilineaceae bacterium]
MNPDAIILAGGRGIRLQSIVYDRPKPMALVNERPFVEWLIRWLRRQGVRRVVLATGYMAEAYERYFGNGAALGIEIHYSVEQEPLGTGGALRRALDSVQSDEIIVLNGDSYCQADLTQLRQRHREQKAQVTVWLTEVGECDRYGAVRAAEDGAVIEFCEKQPGLGRGAINAGIYWFQRAAVEIIPLQQNVSLERDLFPSLIGKGLYSYTGHGPFIDIGTPDSYAAAGEYLRAEFARLEVD